MVLMILRRNYSLSDLAFRFNVSLREAESTVTQIIEVLHDIFYTRTFKGSPFPPLPCKESVHDEFKYLPCKVMFEPYQVECNGQEEDDLPMCYRCFIGVSSSKRIIYISDLTKAELSYTEIFQQSDAAKHLNEGDMVMASKDFEIQDSLPQGVFLNESPSMPSSVSSATCAKYHSKARCLIGRTTLQYLRRNFILNSMPCFLDPIRNKVWQLCAALVNCQPYLTSVNKLIIKEESD